MTTAASGAAGEPAESNPPGLTPRESVERLLALIRGSSSLGDVTPERLGQAFGVQVDASGEAYGFGGEVAPGWARNVDYSAKYRRLRFSFDPLRAGDDADMQGVCYEFDRLSSELEGMGFSRQEQRGEHGRLVQYRFERMRDGELLMWLDVMPQGELAGNDGAGGGRTCVRAINVY